MPTDFASYDLNKDNSVTPDEFAQASAAPTAPAGPPEKPAGMPDAIWQIVAPYWGYTPSPDDVLGMGNAQVNMSLQQMLQEQQYQQDYLKLKQQELGLSQQQVEQAAKEFAFQSGEYWDFFSGDYFDFQKQIEANKVAMSNNQVAMSNNQVLQSEHDIDKSRNYAAAQMYQTDAAKAQSEAAKLQAYAAMGMVDLNPPAQPQPRIQGAGNPFRY